MIEGCNIKIKMVKVMRKGMLLDKGIYNGIISAYDSIEEKLLVETTEETLLKLKLDAKYECSIESNDGKISCIGCLKERYQSNGVNKVEILIEHGFYENL